MRISARTSCNINQKFLNRRYPLSALLTGCQSDVKKTTDTSDVLGLSAAPGLSEGCVKRGKKKISSFISFLDLKPTARN